MPARSVYDADYHMGHLFIDCLRRRKADDICQIDAATGQEETYGSVLNRSIRLARCFRKLGLKPGDVLALGGKNHIDLHIPYYAGLMNGLPLVGVDPQFKFDEIKSLFKLTLPKIAFCDSEHYDLYIKVVDNLNLDTRVVSFGGEHSMGELISTHNDDQPIQDFEPAIFDLDKIYAWLVSSGGTSGVFKIIAIKHKVLIKKLLSFTLSIFKAEENEKAVQDVGLNLSPVQWVSGFFNAVGSPLMNHIKLQTSAPVTAEHVIDMINKYKPVTTMVGSSLLTAILKHEKKCDFTSFNTIAIGGGKVYKDLLIDLRKRMRADAAVIEVYGQTENIGPVFKPNPKGPLGNCGQKIDSVLVKLMDPETGNEIKEPFLPGELWTKGDCFTEYYNDPVETALAFAEDGWYKTGDILYRDEEYNFYFVERLKMLIKYKNYHVAPPELEEVIRSHEGVHDVAVTAIPDVIDGELPVACVVKREGSNVTAQEIKNLVADKLSDSKHLRGGVVFLDQIPLTSAGKVARSKLKKIVLEAERE